MGMLCYSVPTRLAYEFSSMVPFFASGNRNRSGLGVVLFIIAALVGGSRAVVETIPGVSAAAKHTNDSGGASDLASSTSFPDSADHPVVLHPRRLPHRVLLRWSGMSAVGGTSENALAGYNVYRRTIGRPYRIINASVIPIPRYIDFRVKGGVTYFYYTTAVNVSGAESGPSNMTKVVIPFP